jgi:hypothetical protein
MAANFVYCKYLKQRIILAECEDRQQTRVICITKRLSNAGVDTMPRCEHCNDHDRAGPYKHPSK